MASTSYGISSTMTSIYLPADGESQVYLTVSAIVAGTLFLLHEDVFQDCVRDEPESDDTPEGTRVPTFAFLLQHPQQGKLFFDLGLRKNGEGYAPSVMEGAIPTFKVECDEDIVDIIAKADPPIEPQDINFVIYSHLHFDHVGDLAPFSRATLVMSRESKIFTLNPYPDDPRSKYNALPTGQRVCYLDFAADASPAQDMPHARLIQPLGSFDRAIDLFGDGSLYLIDTPGHMSGHMTALARVAKDAFVLLAADTCHSRQCYAPSSAGLVREISSLNYQEWDVAKATVTKLTEMSQMANVIVVLAHEVERLQEKREEDTMPLFPQPLNAWASQQLEKKSRK
ncbi:beta-lactamase-like protein [Suillus clintonianus]|uniref:beta-lactamase-like protein n=1 Tax=Suillus clintonianus TaxID=1904413 RepID=UPI001B85DF23|nr:beta-lactamase-like protein [Suillus clintonianus]KAG2155680.1 beta-lactamase-like protein [Suillus clintonianus]